eukprot:863052-Rhodomonas_salina.1
MFLPVGERVQWGYSNGSTTLRGCCGSGTPCPVPRYPIALPYRPTRLLCDVRTHCAVAACCGSTVFYDAGTAILYGGRMRWYYDSHFVRWSGTGVLSFCTGPGRTGAREGVQEG